MFLISKIHEFRHRSRIFLRTFNISGKKTLSKKFNATIKKWIEESKKIIIGSSKNYHQNSSIFKESTNEFGESFEIALFGYKLEILFLKSIIFCLSESTWDSNNSEFYEKFNDTMKFNGFIDLKDECKEGLLKDINDAFHYSPRSKYTVNVIIENKSSNSIENINSRFFIIPRESHYIYKDENNSWR